MIYKDYMFEFCYRKIFIGFKQIVYFDFLFIFIFFEWKVTLIGETREAGRKFRNAISVKYEDKFYYDGISSLGDRGQSPSQIDKWLNQVKNNDKTKEGKWILNW